MRIGFYIGDLKASDGGVYTLESSLLNALLEVESQHELFVFSAREECLTPKNRIKIVKVNISQRRRKNRLARWINGFGSSIREPLNLNNGNALTDLNSLARKHAIDLMWFFNGYDLVDMPYVMTVQDLQHRKQPIFPEVNGYGWKWHEREHLYSTSLRRASFLISGSDEGKRDIEYFYQIPPERVHVLKLPTPEDTLQPHSNRKSDIPKEIDRPFIFYPAQYWCHKNHETLLLALAELEKRKPGQIGLVLTGADKGNLSFVEQRIKELKLERCVQMLGVVDRATILALYTNAEALVFPSLFGPDNIPPLEAFALRCPVIAGDLPGSREYFDSSALFVNPTDEIALAEAIEKILGDRKLRDHLVAKGVTHAAGRTPQAYLKEAFRVIDRYTKQRRCWGQLY